MYYWSRWSNILTTETRVDESQENRASWRDTAPRLEAQRPSRPVVVVMRTSTRQFPTPAYSRRERVAEREKSAGISLDIQRPSYAPTRTHTTAGRINEATTQSEIEEVRL